MNIKEATIIRLNANSGQDANLIALLKQGADIAKKTEPNTKLWFALKKSSNEYAIFDAFINNEGRLEHFKGRVADALQQNANTLVTGGWQKGVLENASNATILSSTLRENLDSAQLATLITFKAIPGQERALADLLTSAASIVQETEPHTIFWIALKFDDETYGIFDLFEDESARAEHFSGQVATILKKRAKDLVSDGWENGIIPNIENFTIVASK